jgi:hypothetical protein
MAPIRSCPALRAVCRILLACGSHLHLKPGFKNFHPKQIS